MDILNKFSKQMESWQKAAEEFAAYSPASEKAIQVPQAVEQSIYYKDTIGPMPHTDPKLVSAVNSMAKVAADVVNPAPTAQQPVAEIADPNAQTSVENVQKINRDDITIEEHQQALINANPLLEGMTTEEVVQQVCETDKITPSILESKIEEFSRKIDEELKKDEGSRNMEMLNLMVFCMIMLLMTKFKKFDGEYETEAGLRVKYKTQEIKDTYNTWPNVLITGFAAGVSIVGGAAGLSVLLPATVIAAQTAQSLASAANAVSIAGQSTQSVGGLFSQNSEAKRGVLQHSSEVFKEKKEKAKEKKQQKSEEKNAALQAMREFMRTQHEVKTQVASPA